MQSKSHRFGRLPAIAFLIAVGVAPCFTLPAEHALGATASSPAPASSATRRGGAPRASAARLTVADTLGLASLNFALAPIERDLALGGVAPAESAARILCADVDSKHGPRSLLAARAIDVLVRALVLGFKAPQPATLELARRAVDIRERHPGGAPLDLAGSLTNLGDVYYYSERAAEAVDPYQRSLALRETAEGADHPDVADALNRLSDLFTGIGRYDDALGVTRRELKIAEARDDTSRRARALESLGTIQFQQGSPGQAVQSLELALALRTASLGPDHLRVAPLLRTLALARSFTGEYENTLPLLDHAVAIYEKAYGPDDVQIAETLGYRAQMLSMLGRDAEARGQYERCLKIIEKVYPPNSMEILWGLDNLASHMAEMGEHQEARERFAHELDLTASNTSIPVWLRAKTMEHLALEMAATGDTAEARPLAQRALAACLAELGPKHPRVAESRGNLSQVLRDCGDLAGAERELRAAIAAWDSLYGADHPMSAGRCDALAGLVEERDPAAAESLYRRAASLREKTRGPEDPGRAPSLVGLACMMRARGDDAGALRAAIEAESLARTHFQQTARVLTERQALQYASARASGLDLLLAMAERGADGAALRSIWDALIRSRAIVLDEMAARGRATARASDSTLAPLVDAYTRATARLAHLTLRGPGDAPPATFRATLDEARTTRAQAEAALAEHSAAFRREVARQKIGLTEVEASLPSGTALVAFAHFESAGEGSRSARADHYLAFVQNGRGAVHMVPLGDAGSIDSLIGRYGVEVRRRVEGRGAVAEALYRRAAGPLRERIWDPIQPQLAGDRCVLIVPDGALNLVSFASLPVGNTEYLIEHGPLIHYLSAEREVVADPGRPAVGRGLLALGGIDFDASGPAHPADAAVAAVSGVDGAHETVSGVADQVAGGVQGRRSSCPEFGALKFPPLPFTLTEAQSVARIWKKRVTSGPRSRGVVPEVTLLTGGEASKIALTRLVRGRRVVHIATHGFDLFGDCPPSAAGPARRAGPASGDVADADPLMLTGLALAGANQAASPQAVDDGTLSAAEVAATLDLSGVEWAVLSACETGTGGVRRGEGVFGLRRAFQLAGARTLIMSLWPVEDESTLHWMTTLYHARFFDQLGTAESIRTASLALLRSRRAHHLSGHPFYWAGFIGAGDWN